jgi:hypothetical protein
MKKAKPRKTRNWHAVAARQRAAGPMKDKKKEAAKKACRGKVYNAY